MLKNKLIVVTRAREDAATLSDVLRARGAYVYELPTIQIVGRTLEPHDRQVLSKINSFDYILFTSARAAGFFASALAALPVSLSMDNGPRLIAVGSATARKLSDLGFAPEVVSEKFTSHDMARTLASQVVLTDKKILLPRSAIAGSDLETILGAAGANITVLDLYTTEYISEIDNVFCKKVAARSVDCITFTSPSAVAGFFKRIKHTILENVLEVPVVCIGSRTAATARTRGFRHVLIAPQSTTEGIVSVLNAEF